MSVSVSPHSERDSLDASKRETANWTRLLFTNQQQEPHAKKNGPKKTTGAALPRHAIAMPPVNSIVAAQHRDEPRGGETGERGKSRDQAVRPRAMQQQQPPASVRAVTIRFADLRVTNLPPPPTRRCQLSGVSSLLWRRLNWLGAAGCD
jgi:phosphate starvation-inducible protein PhoH